MNRISKNVRYIDSIECLKCTLLFPNPIKFFSMTKIINLISIHYSMKDYFLVFSIIISVLKNHSLKYPMSNYISSSAAQWTSSSAWLLWNWGFVLPNKAVTFNNGGRIHTLTPLFLLFKVLNWFIVTPRQSSVQTSWPI